MVRTRVVDERLGDFNAPFLRDARYDYFGILIRAGDDAIRAGLIGSLYGNWLFIALLWVDGALRCHRIGSGLIVAAEALVPGAGVL
jgi:hypothetical protein